MNPDTFSTVQAGERTDASGNAVSNQILLALPEEEFALIRPRLDPVDLPRRMTLHDPGRPLEFLCFPNRGLISVVVTTKDGRTVEAGLIGHEGCAGTALAVNVKSSPLLHVVQLEGEGTRLSAADLQDVLPLAPKLRLALSRFAVIQGIQTAQTAACNRLHDVEQRLARWLLMAQDRVETGWLGITHDFLATMLGTDRPTVSVAAGHLQDRRAIEYVPGAVRIVSHHTLEQSACECYDVMQQFNGELGIKQQARAV
jgi:CRP-like cAMP-binding protein